MTDEATQLWALASDHEAAVRATRSSGAAMNLSEDSYDEMVEYQRHLARSIALIPAVSMAALAIKAVVALREAGSISVRIGQAIDRDALLDFYANNDTGDGSRLINASLALDLVMLAEDGAIEPHSSFLQRRSSKVKCLADIQEEVVIARRFVACALLASRQVAGDDGEALTAVLFDAGDKLLETIEDLAALRGLIHEPTGPQH